MRVAGAHARAHALSKRAHSTKGALVAGRTSLARALSKVPRQRRSDDARAKKSGGRRQHAQTRAHAVPVTFDYAVGTPKRLRRNRLVTTRDAVETEKGVKRLDVEETRCTACTPATTTSAGGTSKGRTE